MKYAKQADCTETCKMCYGAVQHRKLRQVVLFGAIGNYEANDIHTQ